MAKKEITYTEAMNEIEQIDHKTYKYHDSGLQKNIRRINAAKNNVFEFIN